jgi:hypothetical protein
LCYLLHRLYWRAFVVAPLPEKRDNFVSKKILSSSPEKSWQKNNKTTASKVNMHLLSSAAQGSGQLGGLVQGEHFNVYTKEKRRSDQEQGSNHENKPVKEKL